MKEPFHSKYLLVSIIFLEFYSILISVNTSACSTNTVDIRMERKGDLNSQQSIIYKEKYNNRLMDSLNSQLVIPF